MEIKNIRRQVEADTEGKWSARSVLLLLEQALAEKEEEAQAGETAQLEALRKELAFAKAALSSLSVENDLNKRMFHQASRAAETAEARVAELEKALEPFASDYEKRSNLAPGPDIDHWPIGDSSLTYGHLRSAYELIHPQIEVDE